MNTFNTQSNLNEWIQNDWESDDYIENSRRNSAARKTVQKTDEPTPAWAWVLAVVITLVQSPLFWIAIVALAFWIDR